MSQSHKSSISTDHPWNKLEASLQMLYLAYDASSQVYVKALIEVMSEVELGASRILRSPKSRLVGIDCRDIAQEWWARMQALGFRRYEPQLGPIHPFCYRILCNLCHDAARKARVRRTAPLPLQLEAAYANACEETELTELRARVRIAVQQLPKRLRVPLKLRHLRGFSANEAARWCKVSPQTINSRTFTARARLRQLLADSSGVRP